MNLPNRRHFCAGLPWHFDIGIRKSYAGAAAEADGALKQIVAKYTV